MLRFMIIAIALLFVSPAWSQDRIFRASQIDLQQNKRLDTLESQHVVFRASTESRLRALEAIRQQPIPAKTPAATVNAYPPCPITNVVPLGPTVLMITNGRCSHCDAWWATYEPDLTSKGWTVTPKVGEYPEVASYPTFMVFNRERWVGPFEGKMDMNDLRRLLGIQVPEPAMKTVRFPVKDFVKSLPATSGRYTTAELRDQINGIRPGGWRGPIYADVAPRSQAKQHLVGPEHGFSWDQVEGLTLNEALILHDLAPRHGNKIFPYRTGQAIVTRSPAKIRSEPAFMGSGGCPNGQCAKQSRSTSRWFRR